MGNASKLMALMELAGRLLARPRPPAEPGFEGLAGALERLEKQVARAGKEQFRAAALAESQQQKIDALLEEVRGAEAFRERQLERLRGEAENAERSGRLEILERLLPVLDGLDAAAAALPPRDATTARPWSRRLHSAWMALRRRPPRDATVEAWSEGLALVVGRLQELLAEHDITPIDSEGCAFDPALHVALESVPARGGTPPGRIVREIHRGYRIGDQVLRYAEVVVAK